MNALKLQNHVWALTLLPQWGGRIGSLRCGGMDVLTPIHAQRFDPLNWPRGGAYPLLPYSNRLRNARLEHAGRVHSLPAHPATQPHTLHGVSHTLAWEVLEHSTGQAMLACEYSGEHWPWPARFEQHYSLEGNRLNLELRLTNLGATAMPGGIGLHPYFQRHAGMTARVFVEKAWDIDAHYLPAGTAKTVRTTLEFSAEAQQELALYASGWDGNLWLGYPSGSLLVTASAPLTHFVAFAPAGAPYLCLEPVSHLADAFNTPQQHWREQGTQVLEPGQTLSAELSFTWLPSLEHGDRQP